MRDFEAFFAETAALVDAHLDRRLPRVDEEPRRLHEAIRWSVFAGGKRFRPAILIAAGRTFDAPDERLVSTAAAVEMIHTFSLIHDDLPAMDDDDLRRGKETCHKKFDEATAILAGDALQTLAFRTLACDESLPISTRLELIAQLAAATGTPDGMVAGQQLDLEAEGKSDDEVELENIHKLKTGALICFSANAGALIGDAEPHEKDAVSLFAHNVGLLFQITDDLLDVSQSTTILGKTAGKDAAASKTTYPSKFGYEESLKIAARVRDNAEAALSPLSGRPSFLHGMADYILHRVN